MLPFKKVYVLNVYDRKDRLADLQEEMNQIDAGPYEVVYAIPGDSGFQSFCRSQHHIIQRFVDSGAENCLILEDDVWFQDMVTLGKAMKELPDDWQILYLGANVSDGVSRILENQPEKFSRHLVRIKAGWTSHAIAYRRPIAEMILNHYDPDGGQMFDDYLCEHILPTNPCYLVRPMVALQKPGKSDLWNGYTDYSDAWNQSNRKIMLL